MRPLTNIFWLAMISMTNSMVWPQTTPLGGVDKMMQNMLHLTAEQPERLRSVEVPIKSEKEYGARIFDSSGNN